MIPTRRRGPQKGYLHLLESKLNDYEAVLGVVLSSEDPSVQTFFRKLKQDEFARRVLHMAEGGSFGPHAIRDYIQGANHWNNGVLASRPMNAWQVQTLRNLQLSVTSLQPFQSTPMCTSINNYSTREWSPDQKGSFNDDLALPTPTPTIPMPPGYLNNFPSFPISDWRQTSHKDSFPNPHVF